VERASPNQEWASIFDLECDVFVLAAAQSPGRAGNMARRGSWLGLPLLVYSQRSRLFGWFSLSQLLEGYRSLTSQFG